MPRARSGVDWRRIDRPTLGRTAYGGLGGVGTLGGVVAGAIASILEPPPRASSSELIGSIVAAPIGVLVLAVLAPERLVLFEDAIEVRELGVRRRLLRRDEIRGRRVLPTSPRTLVLELADGKKPARIRWISRRDALLDAWLASFPDLDARGLRALRGRAAHRGALHRRGRLRRRLPAPPARGGGRHLVRPAPPRSPGRVLVLDRRLPLSGALGRTRSGRVVPEDHAAVSLSSPAIRARRSSRTTSRC